MQSRYSFRLLLSIVILGLAIAGGDKSANPGPYSKTGNVVTTDTNPLKVADAQVGFSMRYIFDKKAQNQQVSGSKLSPADILNKASAEIDRRKQEELKNPQSNIHSSELAQKIKNEAIGARKQSQLTTPHYLLNKFNYVMEKKKNESPRANPPLQGSVDESITQPTANIRPGIGGQPLKADDKKKPTLGPLYSMFKHNPFSYMKNFFMLNPNNPDNSQALAQSSASDIDTSEIKEPNPSPARKEDLDELNANLRSQIRQGIENRIPEFKKKVIRLLMVIRVDNCNKCTNDNALMDMIRNHGASSWA